MPFHQLQFVKLLLLVIAQWSFVCSTFAGDNEPTPSVADAAFGEGLIRLPAVDETDLSPDLRSPTSTPSSPVATRSTVKDTEVVPPPLQQPISSAVPHSVPPKGVGGARVQPLAETAKPLSLDEAIRAALVNCRALRTLEGEVVELTGVTAYDPSAAQAKANAALAAFDPTLSAGYTQNRFNQPPNAYFGPGIPEDGRRDERTLSAALTKPWATGGQTSIAYNPPTGYLYFPNGNGTSFNPTREANVEFGARQPLLRGAGLTVNRTPLVIAQLRADQSAWEFKTSTLAMVRSIHEAYWNLQSARVSERAIVEVTQLVAEVSQLEQDRFQAKRSSPGDLAKSRALLHQYRQELFEAQERAGRIELQLQDLLGIAWKEHIRLEPVTLPERLQKKYDLPSLLAVAFNNRPSLVRQRLNVQIRELELNVAHNNLLPQLDIAALYRINGVGQSLDDALGQLTTAKYSDWQAGVAFSMPLGNRAARENEHAAADQWQREREILAGAMQLTSYELANLLRDAQFTYAAYIEAEERVAEVNHWVDAARTRYQSPPVGDSGEDWLLVAVNEYYQALRAKSNAATDAANLLARYNTLLARLQEVQGTLLCEHEICMTCDPCNQVNSPLLFPAVNRPATALPARSSAPPAKPVCDPAQSAVVAPWRTQTPPVSPAALAVPASPPAYVAKSPEWASPPATAR